MAHQLEIIENTEQMANHVQALASQAEIAPDAREGVLLCRLGGGILQLAETAFPDTDIQSIYARHYQREPQGQGPHFDIYSSMLNPSFPYLVTYNLAGTATLTATRLPDDLSRSYETRFPVPSNEATEARRHFSEIALGNSPQSIGTITPGAGMVLLQKSGLHIVHDIRPDSQEKPGEFVKLVCPSDTEKGKEMIEIGELVPLDTLVTDSLKKQLETPRIPVAARPPSLPGTPLDSGGRGLESEECSTRLLD